MPFVKVFPLQKEVYTCVLLKLINDTLCMKLHYTLNSLGMKLEKKRDNNLRYIFDIYFYH